MVAATDPQAGPVSNPMPKPENRVWKKFRHHRSAMLGGFLVLFFIAIAILAPILPIPEPQATDWGAVREAPSMAHLFGTDEIGRDVLARMIWGAQASLLAGVVSVGIAVLVGVPFGLVAGYFGGWIDAVISRVTEALLAVPFLIAIGISATPIFIRLTRGQVISVKVEDYVDSARAIGLPTRMILSRYILPNVAAPILVQATLTIATAIIAEASLSFLGLGQQPPAPSWGSMLNTAKNFLNQAPWMALWPGISIFLVVLGFNLLGDGLRDALDPREH